MYTIILNEISFCFFLETSIPSSLILGKENISALSFRGTYPSHRVIEDKQAQEQLRLIAELDNDDRAIIFKMIDKMLTSQKFKEFFKKNVASL